MSLISANPRLHQGRKALAFLLAALLCTPFLAASTPAHAEGAATPAVHLRLLKTLQAPFVINRLVWHPDNRQVATAQNLNKTVLVWDTATGKVIHTIKDEAGGVGALAYSPDGKYLGVGRIGTRLTPDHAHVHLYDANVGALVRRFVPPAAEKGDANDVGTLVFSPDAKQLAVDGYGGKGVGVIYALATGEVIKKLGDITGTLHSLAFSPDGRWLAVGRTDRVSEKKNEKGAYELASRAQLWDTASWSLVQQSTAAGSVSGLAFSPDGRHLAVGQTVEERPGATVGSKLLPYNDKTAISILAVSTFSREKIMPVHVRNPKTGFLPGASLQAYSGDGRFMFTSGLPAKVVDVRTGKILREMEFGPTAHIPAVSKDSKYLAVASGQEVRLYELVR